MAGRVERHITKTIRRGFLSAALLLPIGACAGGDQVDRTNDESVAAVFLPALQLQDLPPSEPAQGRVGPGGLPFQVALRSTELTHYPCSSCHLEGGWVPEDRTPDAHADIQALHPSAAGGACVTCHLPDRVDQFPALDGSAVSLDHSYRLCAGCHFAQSNDWAGGAHGKRMVGWEGERVVANCAFCHNPHSPGFEQRIPYPGPTLPRNGGRTP